MEDEKIIALYWQRDERAIDETAGKYGRLILSIAYRILHNQEDAQECENDTYHAAWNRIPPEIPRCLHAFLGRIARNIACDRYDYCNAKKRNHSFDLVLDELKDCLKSSDTVDSHLEQQLTAQYISEFLNKTHYSKRVLFIRRYWYCDSIAELAERFGYRESRVKSMLMRTRKELRQYLIKRGISL